MLFEKVNMLSLCIDLSKCYDRIGEEIKCMTTRVLVNDVFELDRDLNQSRGIYIL